jgi:hypothetical protein
MIQHPHVKVEGGNAQPHSSLPSPPAGTDVQLYVDSFTLLEKIKVDNGFDSENNYSKSPLQIARLVDFT